MTKAIQLIFLKNKISDDQIIFKIGYKLEFVRPDSYQRRNTFDILLIAIIQDDNHIFLVYCCLDRCYL